MISNRHAAFIVKQSSGTTWKFQFKKADGIIYQLLLDGKWSEKQVLYQDAIDNFYVLLNKNDDIYLFTQDLTGNILLYLYNNSEWKNRIILFRKAGKSYSINLNAVISKDDINLFYNVPNKDGNSEALIHQVFFENKEWNSPKLVDMINPQFSLPFTIIKNTQDNVYAFYLNNNAVCGLGYKKLSDTANIWTDFYEVDKNNSGFADYSMVATDKYVHVLYIKKEDYVSKLMYRCKNSILKEPVVLFESDKLQSCSIFMIDNHIWATWLSENKIYSSFSTDYGDSFSSPSIYKNFDNNIPVKVSYQTNFTKEKEHLLLNELFLVDSDKMNILLLPEVFPAVVNVDTAGFDEAFESPVNTIDTHLKYIKDHLSDIYEKIYLCKKQLREKDQLINQLNYTLERKNTELITLEHTLFKTNEKLDSTTSENRSLKEKISILEQKLFSVDKQFKSLESSKFVQQQEIDLLKKKLNEVSLAPLQVHTEPVKKQKSSLIKKIFLDD